MRKDGLTVLPAQPHRLLRRHRRDPAIGGRVPADAGHRPLQGDQRRARPRGCDDVLVWLATRSRAALPSGSFAGRLGGEEFGVFLPGIGIGEALIYAEAQPKARRPISAPGLGSAGRSRQRRGGGGDKQGDIAALYPTSDTALYRAKREGRNRVAAGGQIPPC